MARRNSRREAQREEKASGLGVDELTAKLVYVTMCFMVNTHITLVGTGIQDVQELDITISVVARVHIEAKRAQRDVTAWLVSEVGNMLIAGRPQLVIDKTTVWRVPIVLTSSIVGTVGEVGWVDVDGENGRLLIDEALPDTILSHVQSLTHLVICDCGGDYARV